MNRRHITQRFKAGDSIQELATRYETTTEVIEEALRSYWNETISSARLVRSLKRESRKHFADTCIGIVVDER